MKNIKFINPALKILTILFILLSHTGKIQSQITFGGTIENPSQTIAFNTIPDLLTVTGSIYPFPCNSNLEIKWEYSTDNIDFNPIYPYSDPPPLDLGTSENYQPPALTQTTYFRRRFRCQGTGIYYTNIAIVNVLEPSDFGVPAATHSVGNPDSSMNWVLERTYGEHRNVMTEEKSFFDYTGRLIQQQSKIHYRTEDNHLHTHVLARQPLRDVVNRDAAMTLAAPIDNSEFEYRPDFVQDNQGLPYSYKNFDRFKPLTTQTDKTRSADPVSSAEKGTLGWYYSKNNYWEPYTPSTSYPYSRNTYFKDGTNDIQLTGGPDESLRVGTTHETASTSMPVYNELDFYFTVRNKYFSSLGELPVSIQKNATQVIDKDPNGRQIMTVYDKAGNLLMKAGSGNELMVNTEIQIGSGIYTYLLNGSSASGYVSDLKITGDIDYIDDMISIYESVDNGGVYNLIYNGFAEYYSAPNNISSIYKIESIQPFSVSYHLYKGVNGSYYLQSKIRDRPAKMDGNSLKYFQLMAPSNATLSGNQDYSSYEAYTLLTEYRLSSLNNVVLSPGLYKVINKSNSPRLLTYTQGLADVSYNFYNQLGQLIASIAPEGVKKLYGTGINNYASKDDVPFISLYSYDFQGRLISSKTAEQGLTRYIYRADGNIRFSQNALQAVSGRYSYTNYDEFGRSVESGEYDPQGVGILFNPDFESGTNPMAAIIENVSPGGGLEIGIRREVIETVYDKTDDGYVSSVPYAWYLFYQDPYALSGRISVARKYSNLSGLPPYSNPISATWYNYNFDGQVLWSVKFVQGLGYKTTKYTYNLIGQLTQKTFQNEWSNDWFVHFYEYDPVNYKLWKVYTNTRDQPSTKKLQATYEYYLHGPLKRIELAGDLQGIDYTYTSQGALKAINNSNSAADPGGDGILTKPDAFGMVLDYYPGDYKNARTNIPPIKGLNTILILPEETYAGNIKSMSWFSKKPASVLALNPNAELPNSYIYSYDEKYQFKESTWGVGLNFSPASVGVTATNQYKESVKHPTNNALPAYDANGNILYLQRTDGSGVLTDRFQYNYTTGTNKLSSVVNDAGGSPQTYASYSYDLLGRLTGEVNMSSGVDKSKYLSYDVTGKVTGVYRDAGKSQKIVEYVYDELGQRIIKKSYDGSYQLVQQTYYLDGVIYTQPVTAGVPGLVTAQEYELDGGSGRIGVYYRPSNIYAYELSDHLGNVRAVVAKSGSSLEVRMYTDYYPYGMVLQQGGTNDYRYEYQGQYAEKEKATDWNAFELRMYDSRIARWLSVDPKGEFFSPYVGMGNDPIGKTDPDGGQTDNRYRRYVDADGNYLYDEYVNNFGGDDFDVIDFVQVNGAPWKNKELGTAWIPVMQHYTHNIGAKSSRMPGLKIDFKPGAEALERPAIDPVDIIAGSLVGIGKMLVKGAAMGGGKVKYIGRLEDLKGIPRNQTLLDDLPNLGSPKANYYQNMSVLRKALREGYTIKDASWFRPNSQLAPTLLNPNRTVGQTFLGAERNLLNNRGLWP